MTFGGRNYFASVIAEGFHLALIAGVFLVFWSHAPGVNLDSPARVRAVTIQGFPVLTGSRYPQMEYGNLEGPVRIVRAIPVPTIITTAVPINTIEGEEPPGLAGSPSMHMEYELGEGIIFGRRSPPAVPPVKIK